MVQSTTGLTRDQARAPSGRVRGRDRHAGGHVLRRGAPAVERGPRPPAGGHRPAADGRGRRDGDPVRPRARPRAGGPVRRPQPGRALDAATAASSSTCRGCAASRSIRRRAPRGSNGGALLGELDVAAQAHGLVCPVGVIGHTGVAGLTLGGGVGRLQRRFGLTIDNLRAVELVTADGRFVRASETEEPELFWGIRGAGWNFGIVTAFEFGLHPFGPELHRGVRVYPASAAREVWQVVRRLRGHRAGDRLDDLRDRARRRGRGRRPTGHRRRIPSSSSRSTTAAAPTRSSATRPVCAAARSRCRSAAAASRTWRSRPRTTSPSPAADARSSRACTRTASGRRRSTRSSSTSPPGSAGGSFSVTAPGRRDRAGR